MRGYTDEELAQMEASAQIPEMDVSQGYTDEELAKLESENKEPWAKVGPVTIQNNPADVDWLGAVNKRFNPFAENSEFLTGDPDQKVQSMVADNPLLTMSGAVGNAAVGAMKGMSSVAKPAMEIAERAATSPIPAKVAQATNVTGHIKGLASKVLPAIEKNVPESAKGLFDLATGTAGRVSAYSNPWTGVPQGISEAAKVVSKGQKGLAWMLDNAPQKFGKFLPVLKDAAARGADALATTNFLLQQSDPEYQQIIKDSEEN